MLKKKKTYSVTLSSFSKGQVSGPQTLHTLALVACRYATPQHLVLGEKKLHISSQYSRVKSGHWRQLLAPYQKLSKRVTTLTTNYGSHALLNPAPPPSNLKKS